MFAVVVHNFRIVVFCNAKRSSSAEESNQVQIAVCLFSLQFTLGLNFSYTCSYSTVQFRNSFTKQFPDYFSSFAVLLLVLAHNVRLQTLRLN